MILFQRIILQRLNQATADDLLKYSKQYGISLTRPQAIEVANLLYGKNVNIFNESERTRLLKQVEAITSKETAQTVNELFKQIYNLKNGELSPIFYCCKIFSSNVSSNCFSFSISISKRYGGFLFFLSSPTYGVSRIFGMSFNCSW